MARDVGVSDSVALFIDPPSHHFLGDRLFDAGAARYGGENLLAPHIAVRDTFLQRGIAVHTVDLFSRFAAEKNIIVSLGRTDGALALRAAPSVTLSAYFAMECPIVEPRMYQALPAMERAFRRLYSWTDGETLLPFTRTAVHPRRFWWPQSFDAVHDATWGRRDRAFLVMINANKLPRLYDRELYTERLRAVAYFHQFGEIDLYGRNWDRMPNRVGWSPIPATVRRLQGWAWKQWQHVRPNPLYAAAQRASRGPAESKVETLGGYWFAICFENMQLRGWMTEKLFDCLYAGTIPVYWGAPDVAEWVDPACYIDMRSFAGYEDLRRYLRGLGTNEIERMREAGRAFVTSARFDRFRITAFVDLFREIVREDAGIAA